MAMALTEEQREALTWAKDLAANKAKGNRTSIEGKRKHEQRRDALQEILDGD